MRLCYAILVLVGALATVACGLNCPLSGAVEGICVPLERCTLGKKYTEHQIGHEFNTALSACGNHSATLVCCATEDIIEARAKVAPKCLQDRLGDSYRHNGTYPEALSFIAFLSCSVPRGESTCGGSLITSDYVLTAAHCVKDADLVLVYIGSTNLNYVHDDGHIYPDGSHHDLAENGIIIHEKYSGTSKVHDIALLRLAEPVDFSLPNSPKPVCIPTSSQHLEPLRSTHQFVHVFGWGMDIEGKQSNLTQHLMLLQLPLQSCLKRMRQLVLRHGLVIDERSICTINTYQGAYNGWAGSPMLYRSNGVWFLKGIFSYGIKVNNKPTNLYPTVSTSVQQHAEWILEKIMSSSK